MTIQPIIPNIPVPVMPSIPFQNSVKDLEVESTDIFLGEKSAEGNESRLSLVLKDKEIPLPLPVEFLERNLTEEDKKALEKYSEELVNLNLEGAFEATPEEIAKTNNPFFSSEITIRTVRG